MLGFQSRLFRLITSPVYKRSVKKTRLGMAEKVIQRDPRMTFRKTGPSWKDLRGDPRFAALMERMHFPE
jgi:hypothetical protein